MGTGRTWRTRIVKVERFEENSNWHVRKCGSVGVSSTQHGKREMLGRCGDLRRCAFSDFFSL